MCVSFVCFGNDFAFCHIDRAVLFSLALLRLVVVVVFHPTFLCQHRFGEGMAGIESYAFFSSSIVRHLRLRDLCKEFSAHPAAHRHSSISARGEMAGEIPSTLLHEDAPEPGWGETIVRCLMVITAAALI